MSDEIKKNPLKSREGLRSSDVAQPQRNHNSLSTFSIKNVVLPPSSFIEQRLLPMWNKKTSLTSLELHDCELGASGIQCIARFLSTNESLSILDLSSNVMNDLDSVKALSLAIKDHPQLTFVNLSDSNLVYSDQNGLELNTDVLSSILEGCSNLKSLVLDRNDIKIEGAVSLVADFIASNTSLTVLSLANNTMGDANAELLYKAMRNNTSLQELSLGQNRITLPKLLFESKRACEHLTHLDLSARKYGYPYSNKEKIRTTPSVKLIASYLTRNPALIELNLSGNSITSSAVRALTSSLANNISLQHLNLSRNSLTDKCIPSFDVALKKNTTLLSLDLSDNKIKVTGRKELIQSIICDTTSLEAVANSNHTLKLIMTNGKYKNDLTREDEVRNINTLRKKTEGVKDSTLFDTSETEGQKIRYKVVLALFSMNTDLFSPTNFEHLPLELMPRLLELAQHEIGYNGYGEGSVRYGQGVTWSTEKKRKDGIDPYLNRVYEVVIGWNTPLLFNVSFLIMCAFFYRLCHHVVYTSNLTERSRQVEEEEGRR